MADLLGPVMRRADAEVVHRHVPWAMKKNKAFFRCARCRSFPVMKPLGCKICCVVSLHES
jgi:hypothetical protein